MLEVGIADDGERGNGPPKIPCELHGADKGILDSAVHSLTTTNG